MKPEEVEQFNRVGQALHKMKVESNRSTHPSTEDIYLFNARALPHEQLQSLESHLEFCIPCEEKLRDVQAFGEIGTELEREIAMQAATARSRDRLRARVFETTPHTGVLGTFAELPDLFVTLLKSLSATVQVQGAASDLNQLKSVNVPWRDREVEIYLFRRENGIEVYTREAELIGKVLVIGGNKDLKCVFIEDDTTEGMQASGFIASDEAVELELNGALRVGIAD